jgi:hypothetical protein
MNANGLRFDSFLPVWMILGVATLLGIFFIWKEFERKQGYRTLRILAQIIAVISLTVLILRPSVKKEITIGSAVLLTKGYDKRTADSLVSNLGLRVIRMFDTAPFPNAEEVDSWHALNKDLNDIHFVLGEGLPIAVLDEYNLYFNFIGGEKPTGVTQLDIRPFKKNQLNFIQGVVDSNEPSRLKLVGPTGTEDSVQLKGVAHETFSLGSFTKQEGKFLYQLTREVNGRVIESGNLPVEILPERKLNILFLQQYPTFEVRNLKNFLGVKGHAVVLRYQVSKNIFKYEYSNSEKQVFSRLNNEFLNDLDLLITSPEALQELSSSEFQTLESSIKEGLGVMLLIGQPLKKLEGIFPYALVPVNADTVTLTSAQWKEKITFRSAALRLKESSAVTGLFRDKNNNLVSGYFYHGLGKIGFQFLSETYPILLKGKSQEYASIWSPLLEGVSRRKQENFKFKIITPFPRYANQPIDFEIVASQNAPELFYDSIRIPLQEDVSVSQLWHGTIWADAPGWHQFTTQDSTAFSFYVTEEDEWSALNRVNQAHENKMYNANDAILSNVIGTAYTPVSPLFLFVLFVLASGALWLTAKV